MLKYDICMATWNRPNALKLTLDTLLCSDLSRCNKIYIHDDHSTNQDTLDLLASLSCHEKIKIFRQPQNLKPKENTSMCMKASTTEELVIIGSDSKFNKNWLNKMHEIKEKASRLGNWGAVSVTNFKNHKVIKKLEEDFVLKNSISSFATMYRREILNMLYEEGEAKTWKRGYDWMYSDKCVSLGLPIYSTNHSYVSHVLHQGEGGIHGHVKEFSFIE